MIDQPDTNQGVVANEVRRIWTALNAAGVPVPPDPMDLSLRHLARAARLGLCVASLLDAAIPPRSEAVA